MADRNLTSKTVLLAVLLITGAASLATAEKPSLGVQELGKPSNGLRAVLSVNRTSFSPGEILELSGYFWNISSQRLVLPYEPHQWPAGELHIRTPNGDVFVYVPKKHVLPENNFYVIPPGRVDCLRNLRLRLNDSNPGWVAKGEEKPSVLSLRDEGRYQIWFEYEIPVLPKAGKHGWSGKAISNTLAISVQSIPADKRRAKPTPEQLQDLERMISGEPGVTSKEQTLRGMPYHRLREAMLLTENEGLALEITKRVLASWDQNCAAMLLERAGDGLSEEGSGISGPYLKMLADGIVRKLESANAKNADSRLPHRGLDAIQLFPTAIAYARLNPDDKEFTGKLVDILKRSAKVSNWPRFHKLKPADENEKRAYPPVDLTTAWHSLLLLGVLHDGMSVEDAIDILGEPTSRSKKYIRWYYSTPRHVNPVIFGEVKDGKVVSFRISKA